MKDLIRQRILEGCTALGNSDVGLKELCSDLVNTMDKKSLKKLCEETHLSKATILRMLRLDPAKSGSEYRPMADTCERILRVAGVELNVHTVSIRSNYRPRPKTDH